MAITFLLVQCSSTPTKDTVSRTVDAMASFLKVDDADPVNAPTIIDLDAIDVTYGDKLGLNTKGSYYNTVQLTERNSLVCVFSATDFLLDKSELNRVADALDAGTDIVTENTFAGNQVTDIPEDFRVDEDLIEVNVPIGAHYLFVGNSDSKQEDNSNTPEGFSIEITIE